MTKDNHESIFMRNIQRGIDKGIIKVESDGSKVTYYCSREFTDNFKDPEERVRASYFCELVLDYDYPKEKIDLEVKTKPDKDSADIVVYEDDELKSPYLVVECKKDGISSSLVFVRKKKDNEKTGNYPIFMAIAEHIGYDATGRKDPINNLNTILQEYGKFEKNPKGYKGV